MRFYRGHPQGPGLPRGRGGEDRPLPGSRRLLGSREDPGPRGALCASRLTSAPPSHLKIAVPRPSAKDTGRRGPLRAGAVEASPEGHDPAGLVPHPDFIWPCPQNQQEPLGRGDSGAQEDWTGWRGAGRPEHLGGECSVAALIPVTTARQDPGTRSHQH